MKPSKKILLLLSACATSTLLALDMGGSGTTAKDLTKSLYQGEGYSPYANRSFPSNIYWGETHLHTGVSLDAGLFGCTLGHEDAYRFARGEQKTMKQQHGPIPLGLQNWLLFGKILILMQIKKPSIMRVSLRYRRQDGYFTIKCV